MKGIILYNLSTKKKKSIPCSKLPFKDSIIESLALHEFGVLIPCPKQLSRIKWELVFKLEELLDNRHLQCLPISELPKEVINLLDFPKWATELEVWK